MTGQTGKVFTLAEENPFVLGCTISSVEGTHLRAEGGGRASSDSIYHFSLAPGTSISPERYESPKLILIDSGSGQVIGRGTDGKGSLPLKDLSPGAVYLFPKGEDRGIGTNDGIVYTDIQLSKEGSMNSILKAGEVFSLKDLIPYQEGRIVNIDLIQSPHTKFVIMAFDQGTGLSEHAAPGDALIFALDGEGVITYEGVDHPIKAGENFRFAGGGRHAVRPAEGKQFKMALLLEL